MGFTVSISLNRAHFVAGRADRCRWWLGKDLVVAKVDDLVEQAALSDLTAKRARSRGKNLLGRMNPSRRSIRRLIPRSIKNDVDIVVALPSRLVVVLVEVGLNRAHSRRD